MLVYCPNFLAVAIALAGCADAPASSSASVGLCMKIQSADVVNDGSVAEDQSVTSENGNPWGGFIASTENALDGKSSNIVLEEASVLLLESSTQLTRDAHR